MYYSFNSSNNLKTIRPTQWKFDMGVTTYTNIFDKIKPL